MDNTIDNGYYIDSWQYQAIVHDDNTWEVTETLTVNYLEPHSSIHHLLNRFYTDHHPWKSDPSAEFSYYVNIDNVSVKGAEFQLQDASDEAESLDIQIGRADTTYTGKHTYVINYTMTYHADRCEQYDQLFHTLMSGSDPVTVGRFDFKLNFEKELPATLKEPGQLAIYSAPYGTAKNTLEIHCKISDHGISGSGEHLPAHHAITLYSRLPEGFYDSPDSESAIPCYGLLGVSVLLSIYLLVDGLIRRFRKNASPRKPWLVPATLALGALSVVMSSRVDTFRCWEVVLGILFFVLSSLMWIFIGWSSRYPHLLKFRIIRNLIIAGVFLLLFLFSWAMWTGPDSFLNPILLLTLFGAGCLVTLFSNRSWFPVNHGIKL